MTLKVAAREDRGAVAVIVAVFMIVAMILLAFVVDRGRIYVERAQLQNAVDSAALAAVQETCANPINDASVVRQVAVDYAANNGVILTVADTGVGIPAEELPRIFERFYQVDKARGPRRGSGLGLAIVAEIVHAHGGTIEASSGGNGQGATFTVWLPVNTQPVPPKKR